MKIENATLRLAWSDKDGPHEIVYDGVRALLRQQDSRRVGSKPKGEPDEVLEYRYVEVRLFDQVIPGDIKQ